MSSAEATARSLAIFDALCERRLNDFIDTQLVGELTDSLAKPGRAAELLTRHVAPSRARVLARLSARGEGPHLGDAIPSGVLELVIALLPSIPPPPRDVVERVLGSAEVRAEVRRLVDETVRQLAARIFGDGKGKPRGVIGWGARAAASAASGVVGAIGGALGADLDARVGEAVEFGVALVQGRIVDLVSSPESARRFGKELARLIPRLAAVPEHEVARLIERLPLPVFDGLVASVLSHNAARPAVRALLLDEAEVVIADLSTVTLGELLDRFGARAPLRALVERVGGALVAAVEARLAQPG